MGLGAITWLFWPSADEWGASGSDTTTPAEPESESLEEAEARLMGMLPRGYPAAACEGVVPSKGALAQVSCSQNADPGGPLSATYTLAGDEESLQAMFDGVVGGLSVVNCPGNIQSPVLCPTGVSNAFGDLCR